MHQPKSLQARSHVLDCRLYVRVIRCRAEGTISFALALLLECCCDSLSRWGRQSSLKGSYARNTLIQAICPSAAGRLQGTPLGKLTLPLL